MYENVKLITAMVTPFTADNTLDFDAVDGIIEHLLAHGTQGLVVAGTTGESPTLTHAEKLALTHYVIDKVAGRTLIIANIGTNNTAESIANARELSDLAGVDAVLAVTPYYNKPSQAGMIAHFTAIADASSKPVMLYNIPGRSVAGLTVESVVTLAQHPNITAVKETTTVDNFAAIIAQTTDFAVYTGEDAQTLSAAVVGGAGTISVASHVFGDEMTALFAALENGDVAEAGRLQRYLTPRMNALFAYPSPAPVKYLLAKQGILPNDNVRLPLLPLNADEAVWLEEQI